MGDADVPCGLAAISKVPQQGWAQIFVYCGFWEHLDGFNRDVFEGGPGRPVGRLGALHGVPLLVFVSESASSCLWAFGIPLTFRLMATGLPSRRRRAIKLIHGRIAMLAAMGYIISKFLAEYLAFCRYPRASSTQTSQTALLSL